MRVVCEEDPSRDAGSVSVESWRIPVDNQKNLWIRGNRGIGSMRLRLVIW